MGYGGLGRTKLPPAMQFISPFADVWTDRPTTLRGYGFFGHITDPARSYVGFGAMAPPVGGGTAAMEAYYAMLRAAASAPMTTTATPGTPINSGAPLTFDKPVLAPKLLDPGSLPPTPLVPSSLAPRATDPTYSTAPPRPGDLIPGDEDTVGFESASVAAPAPTGTFGLSENTTTLLAIGAAIWFAIQKPKGHVRRELRRARRR